MYKDLFSCEKKVAVVTGGYGLIGKEIVKGLFEFGAKVYIGDIKKENTKEIIMDDRVKYLHLDITSEDSVKEVVSKVVQENGRIDILVNSAYPKSKDWGAIFEEVHYDSWKSNVNSHLGGYFLCCQKVAEQMKTQNGGVIINIASIYGVVAPDFSIYEGIEMTMPAVYSAIKAGVIALTKYIATYYGRYNIRTNTISPGGIFDNQTASFVDRYSKKTPLGRMGKPQEIVGAVIFLASDASSYVTGQNIMVDGGWTVW